MPYIIAALVAATALMGWLLKGAWETNAEQAVAITRLEGERDDAIQAKDTLDSTVAELRAKGQVADRKLQATLKQLTTLKPEEGETDAKPFECLDVPVPAALDRILRNN